MTFPPMSLPASRKFYGSPPPTPISGPLTKELFFLAHSRGALEKVDWPSHPRAVGGCPERMISRCELSRQGELRRYHPLAPVK